MVGFYSILRYLKMYSFLKKRIKKMWNKDNTKIMIVNLII